MSQVTLTQKNQAITIQPQCTIVNCKLKLFFSSNYTQENRQGIFFGTKYAGKTNGRTCSVFFTV